MKDSIPFQFSSSRETKIYSSLKRFVGDAPASFFRDACKIMQDKCDLETKTHLIGHLMREIFGWIVEIMVPMDYSLTPEEEKKSNENKDGYRRKIKYAAKSYGMDEKNKMVQFWLQKIAGSDRGLHSWAHREGMESVRPSNEEFSELWNGTELLLDFLLDKIESNYLGYTNQLDQVLSKKTIRNEDIKKIKQHIPLNQTTMGYFFDKLDHPECLDFLVDNDFFKYPTKPLEHENGGISYPLWPQITYLVKMSKIKSVQEKIVTICLRIKTDNLNTQVNILEIALNLSPKYSVKIIKKSYEWLGQIHSWFHPEKYGQLLLHLVEGGYTKESLELAKRILAIKPDPRKPTEIDGHIFSHEPIALFDNWHYEKILKENYPKLVEKVGIEALKILIDLICDYVKLSDSNRKSGSKDDLSRIWRPAIEDNVQNHEHGIRDVLITGTRDICESFLKMQPDQITTLIEELESKNLNILNRLALHLLRLFPKSVEKEIIERLMNEKEFDDNSRLTHEYFLLAESHGSLLKKEHRDQLLSWIMSGADIEQFKKWRKHNKQKYTDEDGKKYIRSWQMYHLMPFRKLDPAWQKYYDELTKEFGEPKYPTFSSWSEGGSWAPKSGLPPEKMKKMLPEEVLAFLKKWEPPNNDPLGSSREGTGRQLTKEISLSPDKWTQSAEGFIALSPTYVRSYLSGFQESLKQGKKFNWKPILDICIVVLSKPVQTKEIKKPVPFGDDPDWSWCRKTIIDLIEEGFSDHSGKLTLNLRKQVWKIIEILAKDPDPTPKREEEYLTSSKDDPLTLAINSIRGDAISAAIRYGIWIKSYEDEKNQVGWLLSKKVPELDRLLLNHLDIKKDPSLAIRSVYGEKLGNLTWLDESWIITYQNLIFPSDSSKHKYFDAAWESYITFVNAYNNLFKIIKKQYKRAVNEIGSHAEAKHHIENPDQNLAQHLVIFYWRGLIKLTDELFSNFYKNAPVILRSEVIDFIGRVAKKDKDVPAEVKNRFISLLEKRIKEVKKVKSDIQEFENISWWLASKKFSDEWILDKILEVLEEGCELEGEYLVMECFIDLVNSFPLKVVQCLRFIIENDKKQWGTLYLDGDMRSILDSALKSGKPEAKDAAEELIHRLAARGHLEFKDLL